MSATPPRDVPFGLRHAVTDSDRRFYASVYAILCATNVVAVLARTLLFAKIGVTAARHLFAAMLHSTLRSPTSFYDTTPIGRIVSRFAYDTELVDFVLITRVMNAVASFWWILCAIIILVAVAPWVALALVPVLVWYYFMQRFYRTSSRALQRLDSIRCAPAGVARVCVCMLLHLSPSCCMASSPPAAPRCKHTFPSPSWVHHSFEHTRLCAMACFTPNQSSYVVALRVHTA